MKCPGHTVTQVIFCRCAFFLETQTGHELVSLCCVIHPDKGWRNNVSLRWINNYCHRHFLLHLESWLIFQNSCLTSSISPLCHDRILCDGLGLQSEPLKFCSFFAFVVTWEQCNDNIQSHDSQSYNALDDEYFLDTHHNSQWFLSQIMFCIQILIRLWYYKLQRLIAWSFENIENIMFLWSSSSIFLSSSINGFALQCLWKRTSLCSVMMITQLYQRKWSWKTVVALREVSMNFSVWLQSRRNRVGQKSKMKHNF